MQRTGWNKRLMASTRGKILGLLRTENRTVSELAAVLKLTDNAVRVHLVKLERDGLVQQRGTRRGTRKPHIAYGLTAEAEHIFPKSYAAVLNQLLAAVSDRLGPRALRATMRQVGKALAQQQLHRVKGRTRRERLEVALELFTDLGGSAALTLQPGREFIHGRNGCPLSAVSAVHPEACWIMESLLSAIIGVPAKKCCEYGEAPRCCFELKR